MIPELPNGISHRFSKRVNKLLCICTTFGNRASEMSRERSRGQPGTMEIGPVEPRKIEYSRFARRLRLRRVSPPESRSTSASEACFCVCDSAASPIAALQAGLNNGLADLRLTKRIAAGARILKINFLDHVIVGQAIAGRLGYFSFQEAGRHDNYGRGEPLLEFNHN